MWCLWWLGPLCRPELVLVPVLVPVLIEVPPLLGEAAVHVLALPKLQMLPLSKTLVLLLPLPPPLLKLLAPEPYTPLPPALQDSASTPASTAPHAAARCNVGAGVYEGVLPLPLPLPLPLQGAVMLPVRLGCFELVVAPVW